jgi:hypothetical protein
MINLETSSLKIGFDVKTGSLISLFSKVSQWPILDRPHLGLSWRLMLPLKDKHNNIAWGNKQNKPLCVKDGKSVSFIWDGIVSESGEKHSMVIKTTCKLVDDKAVFSMNIKNNDSAYVENVYYPYFGDIRRPSGCKKLSLMHPNYCDMSDYSLYPEFVNTRGYHGDDFPTVMPNSFNSFVSVPMQPYALIQDDQGNGFYIGTGERRLEAASFMAELHPGYREAMNSRVPDGDKIQQYDVFIRFGPVHAPYVSPGSSFDILPFSIEAYKGGWYQGASCYNKISETWNKHADDIPSWTQVPHSWLQIHINSPEDELRIKYKDLPKVGEDCAKYGIKAIQLVGWNNGGQDRGNPYHDIDPRLGTLEELKEAIAKIHAMGVKVIIFSKFTWADRSLENFEKDFLPLAIKDPFGDYYMHPGYQYQSASQFMDIDTRRLIPMCFGSCRWIEFCKNEFKKVMDLGAAGILYDECQHHAHTFCCFDTSHEHRYGWPTYANDETLIGEFKKLVDGREFFFGGEGLYDFQHNYYHLSYTRTWKADHKPTARFMRPYENIMTGIIGFEDRNMINQCLLNRYIIEYEPFNFKGIPSDFPETVIYGNKMDKLRTELCEYFWNGEFRGNLGGSVEVLEGKTEPVYSVFIGTNGKTGMVICNYSEEPVVFRPKFENGRPEYYRLVDDSKGKKFDAGKLEIPGYSAAVLY